MCDVMDNNVDYSKYSGEYSDSRFRKKLKRCVRYAGRKVIYYALELYYVLMSPDVPAKDKSIILGALGYLILPLDMIPDFIPIAGFSDDLAALIAVCKAVATYITPEVRMKALSKLEEW